jgi:4-hydroxy-2-oxoheptanedioate aldolase
MIQVIDRIGTPVFVRVPERETPLVSRVLDAGATGVIVPMIESVEAARRAVEAACYPPLGRRSWGPLRQGYYADRDAIPADGLVLVMLETAIAIERAPDILSVPGVAGAVVGPADLAQSFGLGPSEVAHKLVIEASRSVVALCRERGLLSATGAHSIDLAATFVGLGFDMIAVGRDVSMMREVAAARVAAVRAVSERAEGGR